MRLLYNGEIVGTITTNHSMSVDDAIQLLEIDINATNNGDEVYPDFDLFEMDWSSTM